jgi:hypothetical protein
VVHRHLQVSLAFAAIAMIAAGGCAAAVNESVAAPSMQRQAAADRQEPEPWCRAGDARSVEKAQERSGPLSEVNERFHEAYQRARAEACRQQESRRLVIRYAFGTIEARWNGKDLGPPVVLFTPYVHALKAVSHAVFLAALLFDEPAGTARDAHVAAALQDIEALRAALGDPSSAAAKLLPAGQRPRQTDILALTSAALLALRDHRFDEDARRDYFSAVRAPLGENLREASADVLTLLHRTVQGWKRQVDAADPNAWASVVVVAAVAHQARAREVAVQYFERMLGETVSEGASGEDRLVIVENQPGAADQRGALAAHDVDREHASAIFGDASRLQSDVMADSGGMLDRLLPSAPHAERTR